MSDLTAYSSNAELIYRLGVSLAMGLLVGTERHWHERADPPGGRTAGIRTFGLSGLLGGIAATLGGMQQSGAVNWAAALLIGLVFLGFSNAMLSFHRREAIAEKSFSVTNLVAGQVTFLLGALAVYGDAVVVAAAAVAMTALLAAREGLHGFVSRLTWPELRSAILLLSMTLVALPLVPDQPIEALAGLNFARIWKLAVILATVSYGGYIAVRLLGSASGLLVSGAVTGLVSSTAATITNARQARLTGGAIPVLAASTLIAGAVSLIRTGVFAWGIAPAMGRKLLPAVAVAAIVQAAAGIALTWRWRTPGHIGERAQPGNPFELLAVLQIAGLLGAVELLAKGAAPWLGAAGVFGIAALSGLADVDAVTLSMGSLVPATLTASVAATAILIAVAANNVAKTVYATSLGGIAFGATYGGIAILSLLFGGVLLGLGGPAP